MAESDWLLDLHVVSMVRGSLSTPSTSSSWVLSELSIKLIESISRLSRFVTYMCVCMYVCMYVCMHFVQSNSVVTNPVYNDYPVYNERLA